MGAATIKQVVNIKQDINRVGYNNIGSPIDSDTIIINTMAEKIADGIVDYFK